MVAGQRAAFWVPAAMGLDLQFVSGQGPVFSHPIRSHNDVMALHTASEWHSYG